MTEEQIKNYRAVLLGLLGPYALLMTPGQIQAHRDRLQRQINEQEQAHAEGKAQA